MGVGADPLPAPTIRRLAIAYGALAAVVLLLAAVRVLPGWPGLVHAVSLPPFDLFADLRVVVTGAPSYPVFAAGMVVSLAVRTAFLAWVLGGLDRAKVWFALRVYLVLLPVTFLAASLAFSGYASFGNPFLWMGFIAAIVLALVALALPWRGAPGRTGVFARPPEGWFQLSTAVTYVSLLMVIGGMAVVLGAAGPFVMVPVAAALSVATAWVLAREHRRLLVLRRAVTVGVALAVVAGTAAVVAEPQAPMPPTGEAGPHDGSLLLMSGINSASGVGAIQEIHPQTLGFPCERTWYFSYAGPGDGQPRNSAQCEIRTGAHYDEGDTVRPFEEQVRITPPQLGDVPDPITLLTHSQGIWVVWEAMSREGAMGVDHLVLVGIFRQDLLGYPPPGETGPGRVGVDVLRVVARLGDGAIGEFHPGEDLVQDVMARPGTIERVLSQDLPADVRVLNIPSALDLPLMPKGWEVAGAEEACPLPVTHGNLPYARELHEAVDRFLKGAPQPPCPRWRALLWPAGGAYAPPAADD